MFVLRCWTTRQRSALFVWRRADLAGRSGSPSTSWSVSWRVPAATKRSSPVVLSHTTRRRPPTSQRNRHCRRRLAGQRTLASGTGRTASTRPSWRCGRWFRPSRQTGSCPRSRRSGWRRATSRICRPCWRSDSTRSISRAWFSVRGRRRRRRRRLVTTHHRRRSVPLTSARSASARPSPRRNLYV